jgi:23S rRNA (cytosine1962-C5)-methyltransferase
MSNNNSNFNSNNNTYRLIDCGDKMKLEQLGKFAVIRPCPQAIWDKTKPNLWKEGEIDAEFVRTTEEKGVWNWKIPEYKIPTNWTLQSKNGLKWEIMPNDFGNISVFVEHWQYVEKLAKEFTPNGKILNLFTYSGSNCVYLASKGFKITAVDSSKSAMNSYAANLSANNIDREGHKLVLEDCFKFVQREVRREAKYDAIQIDAPSYGKGTKKELFKIEDHLTQLLKECKKLITDDGKIVMTLHSPRFTPAILKIMCQQLFPDKKITSEEILVPCESGIDLPSGFLVKIY